MLRVTEMEMERPAVSLRLEGRVVGPWAAELRRACEDALAEGGRLRLDLGDVSFVDGDGIAVFEMLRCRAVTLVNASPFVAAQLRGRLPCSLGAP